ncbi:MAG: hypothetical protein ABSB19_14020 [Methylomonas sp.]
MHQQIAVFFGAEQGFKDAVYLGIDWVAHGYWQWRILKLFYNELVFMLSFLIVW